MSFTCGKLIEHIYKMRKGNSDKEFWDKVQQLILDLTKYNESPEKRLSIKEAIVEINHFEKFLILKKKYAK